MVPLAQRALDHRLDGAIEGQGVCLIGSGRGSLLRPLLAAAYCAHAGTPPTPLVAGAAWVVGADSTGAVPAMSAA